MLNGYKSYIVAGIAVVYAISGFLYGAVEADMAFQIFMGALGLSTLRHALSTGK